MTETDRHNAFREYRIGDFARFLGVTAEFLKHYQDSGLLSVDQRPSGYRYYGFEQSERVLQYLRLRNYGVSVKDMKALLTGDTSAAMEKLDEKADELLAQIERMKGVAEEHRHLRAWYEAHQEKPEDWEIRNVEPFYFLSHTSSRDFLRDERIYEILRDWTAWLPVTKSAMRVAHAGEPSIAELGWGLAVRESMLKRWKIPVNGAVRRMTFGKAFVYHFCGIDNAFKMADIASGDHVAVRKMRSLGFEPAGDALLLNEMQLIQPDGSRACTGRFVIPIAA